jgi:DNA-directed RNA polymerase subunit RPC12/RpoP
MTAFSLAFFFSQKVGLGHFSLFSIYFPIMSSDTRQNQTRYWCHICNAEVSIYMAPDPTCQQCNEQFIEEVKYLQ